MYETTRLIEGNGTSRGTRRQQWKPKEICSFNGSCKVLFGVLILVIGITTGCMIFLMVNWATTAKDQLRNDIMAQTFEKVLQSEMQNKDVIAQSFGKVLKSEKESNDVMAQTFGKVLQLEKQNKDVMAETFGKVLESETKNSLGKDGKLQINMGMRNDYTLQDCQNGGLKKSFPDFDYALMGYNILKGYPLAAGHDPGFTRPIFQADYSSEHQSADCKFSVPNGFTVVPDVSCSVSFTSETVKNSEDLKKSMSASAEVSGGGWGVSFSASASYQKDSHTLSSNQQIFVFSTAVCQTYFSRINDIDLPPLDKTFLKWVEKLNNTENTETYLDFISHYGTHYMKTVTLGARYMHQHSMTQENFNSLNTEGVSIEAKASYSGLFSVGGGFGFSDSQSKAVESFNSKVETKTFTVGSAPPKDGDALTWASEAKETPVPYRYELESMENLFNPAMEERYPQFNIARIKLNLEYTRLMHAKDIFQKSLSHLCRVYDAAIPLPETCLLGANYTVELDEMHCIERCLETNGCIGITIRSQRSVQICYILSDDIGDEQITGRSGSRCKSMLFPFKLKSEVDAFSPDEIPGIVTIIGATADGVDRKIDWTPWLFHRFFPNIPQIPDVKGGNGTSCQSSCLATPGCVLAAYVNYKDYNANICKRFTDSEISKLNFKFQDEEHGFDGTKQYYLTFIKTCQLDHSIQDNE